MVKSILFLWGLLSLWDLNLKQWELEGKIQFPQRKCLSYSVATQKKAELRNEEMSPVDINVQIYSVTFHFCETVNFS